MTLSEKLGYEFVNSELIQRALTHKSYHNERGGKSIGHNERLEFLGDAVLELTLSEFLFLEHSELAEGDLSKIRASLVNETTLAKLTNDLQLSDEIRFGKGEAQTGGALKPRLLACALEATIGAMYLDAGYESAKNFILRIFKPYLENLGEGVAFASDYKTRLQEFTQKEFRKTPVYNLLKEEGPDHEKTFFVEVKIEDRVLAEGQGRSKKLAEQSAAEKALLLFPESAK